MLSALGWIPILGPIIQGLTSIYSKFKDNQLGMRQAEVSEEQVSADIIAHTDSIGLRLARDLYCAPAIIHLWMTSWDCYIAKTHKSWMLHPVEYPPSYSWYTYTVAVFLVGSIGMNIWKRFK